MNKWIDAVKNPDWEPNIWTKICSIHFPDSSIYETKNGLRRLTCDAVPSLFLEQPSPSNHHSETTEPVKLDIESDQNNVDTPIIRKLKIEIVRLNNIAKQRRMRCNALYATCRRLKKKLTYLSAELKEVKRKRIINLAHAKLEMKM